MSLWPLLQLLLIWGLGIAVTLWLDSRLRRLSPPWHRALSWYLGAAQLSIWGWLGLTEAFPAFVGLTYRYLAVLIGLTLTALVLQTLSIAILRLLPRHPPRIFFDVAKVLITLAVIMSLVSYLFGVDLGQFFTWLFTISTIGAVVIGFALQETLGNFFAGLGLQIDAPFKLGDWIGIEDFQGEVLSLSWRATILRTANREVISIPNSMVGRVKLKNLSHESGFADYVDFGLAYEVPPQRLCDLLSQAASTVEGVLRQPPVTVFVDRYDDFTINYRVRYWTRSPGELVPIRSQIRQRVWYALQRAGLSVPFPIQNLYLHRPEAPEPYQRDHILAQLKRVDFLQTCEDIDAFMDLGRFLRFTSGEIICRVGDPGDIFYIVISGAVEVLTEPYFQRLALLKSGEYFGEIALLTGQNRTATVRSREDTELFAFNRQAFQVLIDSQPVMASRIAQVIAERQRSQEVSRQSLNGPSDTLDDEQNLFDLVRSGINRIFGR